MFIGGCKALQSVGVEKISVESFENAEKAAEGSLLSTWKFQELKTKKDIIPEISLYNPTQDKKQETAFTKGTITASAQNLARRLADTPSNFMTPVIFCQNARDILEKLNVEICEHDQKWAEQEQMNAFLAVAKGSNEPPRFLELNYKNGGDRPPFVFVGKGVTFDSGGISLKPSGTMDEMRADMSGAACVVATLQAVAALKMPVNLTGLIPLCENMPSGHAIKPGDVVKAKNGKTVCVDNTDAEGRLILADALAHSAKFKPKFVLDIATLTGAVRVALGNSATGVFTNSDMLYEILSQCGSRTGDRVWRLPLWKIFQKQIAEHAAYDLNNIGKGKGGGSCTAAAFLREFVPQGVDWLHLDTAGVMGPTDDTPYLGKGMTGRPTRTLIDFIAKCKDKLE